MLTPVSFKKGRQHAPRLSPPRVPGRHSSRFWSDEEIAIVKEHYETRGPAFCLSLLPRKSLSGVYGRAAEMNLRAPNQTPKAPRVGASLDEAIKAAWPGISGRGGVTKLAQELGIKRHTVSSRAIKLGLALPHKKEPPWTPEEDELLRRAPVNNLDAAVAFFAAHGFKRTATSIKVRCVRKSVSRRLRDVFSGTAAAKVLGVDSKTIGTWIQSGVLAADRRGSKRLPQQGGDTYTIRPAELRRFVLEQLDRIDIRKVDKHAFVALLAGDLDQDANAKRLQAAAIALARSEAGVAAMLEHGVTEDFERWPEMDELVSALDAAAPTWRKGS